MARLPRSAVQGQSNTRACASSFHITFGRRDQTAFLAAVSYLLSGRQAATRMGPLSRFASHHRQLLLALGVTIARSIVKRCIKKCEWARNAEGREHQMRQLGSKNFGCPTCTVVSRLLDYGARMASKPPRSSLFAITRRGEREAMRAGSN